MLLLPYDLVKIECNTYIIAIWHIVIFVLFFDVFISIFLTEYLIVTYASRIIFD